MTPEEGGALERGWASGHLAIGQRWGGPPKVGLGWARTLEKNDLGGITEVLLQEQRGAGTPRGSQVSSGCWPLSFAVPCCASLRAAMPACGQPCSPVQGARLTHLAAEGPGEGTVSLWVLSLNREGLLGP